ncbi:hypothetical protein FFWV33_06005 [Flavobacterium faecale]|uniref:AB hydrolase-1 domain-containing protein n=1 Tax=Flavobacterium faecale TaxID=1355330 RepID=A0A2S1LBJ7_9FLAO|nr:alpha/beta hydrolase [Flavobacterium faecale]AWG21119.1 hypothetical protein FFWV33_06005 [Flavobacterium faecale]
MKWFSVFKKRYLVYSVVGAYVLFCQSCMTMRMSKKETKTFFDTHKVTYVDSTLIYPDHDIHYIQTGQSQNPTLFFVHGSPGSWDAYKDYMVDTLLTHKYRMIAVDRPGFGYSDYRSAQNLQVQAQWLSIFIKQLNNGQPISLVGHSMGGPVVVKLATLDPEAYDNLVILSGALDPKVEKPEKWRKIFMAFPLKYLVPGALRPSNDELWWLKEDLKTLAPELPRITAKVTIIHGTKDPLVPYENMAYMQKEFINAKSMDTISIKDANHFIPWTYYERIRNDLLKLK